eukprot:scaffold7717_cov117-Isochrysis_galbana.AAC.1
MVITSYFFAGVFDRAISVWPVRSAGSSGPCGPCTLRNNLADMIGHAPGGTVKVNKGREGKGKQC